jgi:hypothetical protein
VVGNDTSENEFNSEGFYGKEPLAIDLSPYE